MRRKVYITSRPDPIGQPAAPTYTWEQRWISWSKQLFIVAITATLLWLGFTLWPGNNVYGSVSPDLRKGYVTELHSVDFCAVSMRYAHPEDELCAVWLEGPDQHVVLGPLWAAPANAHVVGG